MQKGPSQVSSGNIAPAVMGPQRDTKDVMILAALVLFLSGLIAAAWFYGQSSEQIKITPATEKVENGSVSEILKNASALNQAEASTTNSTPVTAPAISTPDIIHSDIYFEVGRKGLTDKGKAQLSAQADMLKQHEEYGVLIQGYTDQQGSASYNKQLGLKRAETVKTELLNSGVAEHRMKVVSLGEEGVLCIDNSVVCHTINRRVHMEVRKIGQEHMAAPAVATTSSDPSEAGIDASTKAEETGPPTENLVPLNPEPTPGS
ncbi:MAG: OmpA family protein [Nitrospirae bacterium]|nr:OmpA family protein [Nitrospirota bacterium]